MSADSRVDLVVPVYGAAPDLERCLESVRAHTPAEEHRLIVVLDGPQEEDVERLIAPLAALPPDRALLLRQPARHGFAAAVNRGVGLSTRDVVLLNSDTRVTAGWLGKLRAAANSAPAVGTVTPFTSHGTICSVPTFLAENTVPAGHTIDSFAALVERISARQRPQLPTGVGFCLYVRRRLLDSVGALDERFGLGYGEETDLCRRASAAGFVHLLDDATYVWHRGRASFGAASAALLRRAEARIRRLHPDYMRVVAAFIREDPIAPARARVLRALAPDVRPPGDPGPRRVLHLLHGWPPFDDAPSPAFAQGLARRQATRHEVFAYVRVAWPGRGSGEVLEHYDEGVQVRLLANGEADPPRDGRRMRRDFANFLRDRRPELIHVHDLDNAGAILLWEAARMKVPIVYQLAHGRPASTGGNGTARGRWLRHLGRSRAAAGEVPPGWDLPPRSNGGVRSADAPGMERHVEEVEALYAEALSGRGARA